MIIAVVRLIARVTNHIHFIGLRDGWATCRSVRITGASGRAGGRRTQGALGDAAPLGQHRRGGVGGDGVGRRARAEHVEAVKRMKAGEVSGRVHQLLEPPSQKPLLARQLILVRDLLTLARLQALDKTLGLGQKAQRGVPRGFRPKWHHPLQLFETSPKVSSPIFLQFIMSRSAALGLLRLWPLCNRPHIVGYWHR